LSKMLSDWPDLLNDALSDADETMTEDTLSPTQTAEPSHSVIGWVLLIGALVAGFARNFVHMWGRWFPAWKHTDLSLYDRFVEGQSYYTHGPLIPLLSLFIAAMLIRHVKIEIRPDRKRGGWVLGLSLLFHLMASLARVHFASGFALIGIVVGLVLWFWGTGALRQLWFPIAILFFMVPLPEVTIANLNFTLKMWATDIGVALANGLGVIVERSGNRVYLDGDKTLVIANVCNGLRTLISLLAFGALYCYVCRLRGWWRVGLFAMTIPVAVVANSVRIVSLIVVADIWDAEVATGAYHDWSGIFIFVLAFMLMFGIERFVLWIRAACGKPAEVLPLFDGRTVERGAAPQWPGMSRRVGTRGGIAVGAVLLLVAGGAWWLGRSTASNVSQAMIARAVPAQLDLDGKRYHSYPMELDRNTLTILEDPNYLYRRYMGPSGRVIDYCLIFSKDNRKGTHPPDLCLAGSGEGIVGKQDVAIEGIEGHPALPCREIVVQGDPRRPKHYYLYTYKCGDRYTDSFWVQQLVIFANGLINRNASGALIRVSTSADRGIDEARARCKAMMRASVPHLDRNLP